MAPRAGPKPELPTVHFRDSAEWEAWLDRHHSDSPGVWLRLAKKASGLQSVTYVEAVEVALCFGWIDGQSRRHDEQSWVQRFTPRGRKSVWSKINRERVAALTEARRMRPAGQAAVEAARQDGRWDAAYDPPSTATVPDDLAAALQAAPRAAAFFETLNRTNRYAVIWRVQTAKRAGTRARTVTKLVGMLERGEKLHP